MVGALIASGLILLIAGSTPTGYSALISGMGANGFGAHSPGQFSVAAAFVAETVLTFFLVLTVLGPLEQLWLFIAAPLAGAAISAVLYEPLRIPAPVISTPQAERALGSEQREREKAAGA